MLGSEGCQEALKQDGDAKFAEMAGRSPKLQTRFPDLQMGLLQLTFSEAMALHLPGIDVQVRFAVHNGMSHSAATVSR